VVLNLVIFRKNFSYSSFSVKRLLEHTILYSLEYLVFKYIKIMNNKISTFTNFAFGKYLFSKLDCLFHVFYYQNGGLCKLSPDVIPLLFCFDALRYCEVSACYMTAGNNTVALSKKQY